jgi:hypothetical protein
MVFGTQKQASFAFHLSNKYVQRSGHLLVS